ncbi:MAG TPA: acyltransferase [Candidatus Acidoferrum sp.]|nr:acyltransferase [Candidatus Acidoferrum sp.]
MPGRIPELDGLRGLAILLVIICHYIASADHLQLGYWPDRALTALSVGWSGVDLFFVLSGFLIGGILLDSRSSPNYFRTFYLRRAHRILPIYYAWILLYVLVVASAVTFLPHQSFTSKHDFAVVPIYVFFLQNIFYSLTGFQWRWFVVTWSLAVEEQFYLFAPPLIRFLTLRRLVTLLVIVIAAAPVLRFLAFHYLAKWYYLPQFAMPCRADALAFGILAAVAWRWPSFRTFLGKHPGLLQRVFAYMLIYLTGMLWWLARPNGLVTYTIGYSSLAVFYTCLMLLVLSQTGGAVARMARAGWLRYLGGISYCVYIVHLPIDEFASQILLHTRPRIYDLPGIAITLLAAIVTWLIAAVSWKYFEKPLIRRGHRYVY